MSKPKKPRIKAPRVGSKSSALRFPAALLPAEVPEWAQDRAIDYVHRFETLNGLRHCDVIFFPPGACS